KLWKPFLEKMNAQKKKYVAGEINFEQFQKKLLEIQIETFQARAGVTINFEYLLERQINATINSKTEEEFEDQAGALARSITQMGAYLDTNFVQTKEFKDLLGCIHPEAIAEKDRDPNKKISKALDAIDTYLRKRFVPVFKKAEGSNATVRLLMEMAMLSYWLEKTQYMEPKSVKERSRRWDAGEYPFFTNKTVYNYLSQKINFWLDNAIQILPSRFIQKLCFFLVTLSEMGGDIDLCKQVTLKSLELSEGLITEATPDNISSSLAALYEEQGDKINALKYYLLSIDAIKLAVQPRWTDVIIYRTACILNEKGEKRKALEIIGKYHPAFRGNANVIHMPAREHTLKIAQDLALDMGYKDVYAAIEDILG
ncbi:MAG TPA: hypothetical protein VGB37_07845, partial [Candidatus Lokiarchaeia archaeon]